MYPAERQPLIWPAGPRVCELLHIACSTLPTWVDISLPALGLGLSIRGSIE